MLSITELTKGSLAVEFFRWILLVVDKIVDKVLAASVALAVNKCSPSGNRPAKLPLKRSLDSIPSRKPNAEKSGSQHLTGSLAQGIPRNKAGSARYLAGVDWLDTRRPRPGLSTGDRYRSAVDQRRRNRALRTQLPSQDRHKNGRHGFGWVSFVEQATSSTATHSYQSFAAANREQPCVRGGVDWSVTEKGSMYWRLLFVRSRKVPSAPKSFVCKDKVL